MAHSAPPQRLTIADLLAEIRRLPSILVQLAYLSSLRDPNTGVYTHPAVTEPALRRQADDELRRAHEAAFRRWLNLRLEEQKADLDLCVAGLPSDRKTVLNTWRALETYRTFLPASASPAERGFFHSNFCILLDLPGARHESQGCCSRLSDSGSQWLTARQIAERLGVTDRTVRIWADQGLIPGIKVRRQWRFRRREFEHWLDTQDCSKKRTFYRK